MRSRSADPQHLTISHQARHLNTLAGLISGIVGSNSAHLSKIAKKVPDNTKKESRAKRFSRWVNNERIEFECVESRKVVPPYCLIKSYRLHINKIS
jgi:hypothetical protein